MSDNKKINHFLIAIGPSCSGKTAFSKKYAKDNGATYIDFDLLYDYGDINDSESFMNKLKALFLNSKNNSFVMDGYIINVVPSLNHLEKELSAKIEVVLCMAAPNIIRKRQEKQKKTNPLAPDPISKKQIERIIETCYFVLNSATCPLRIIDTTRDEFEEIKNSDFSQRYRELVFISDLEDMPHDKYYHDISLPSGIKIKGYSDSEGTWKRISSLVNFKDKRVIEFGCFHGFFEFKIEDENAKSILGVERNENAFKIVKRIGWIKNSKVKFVKGDIQSFKPSEKFDIALVLNMLHHVSDKQKALETVFEIADSVIFEIKLEQNSLVNEMAMKYGFEKKATMNSGRELRKIILFQKKGINNLKLKEEGFRKYSFDNKNYVFEKIWKSIKQSIVLYPIKWGIRKYRDRTTGKIV